MAYDALSFLSIILPGSFKASKSINQSIKEDVGRAPDLAGGTGGKRGAGFRFFGWR